MHHNAKLLLILSLILVSLLSNTPFFEFQGKGDTNHNTALAMKQPQ
jgi:hypothetical protein